MKLQWDSYAYTDKSQEAKRLAAATKPVPSAEEIERRKDARAEKEKLNAAWSDKTRKKEEREKRRDKKDRKKKWQISQASSVETAGTKRGADDEGDGSGDDWEDLAREERMAKRVKKGHLSQRDFDAEFADL